MRLVPGQHAGVRRMALPCWLLAAAGRPAIGAPGCLARVVGLGCERLAGGIARTMLRFAAHRPVAGSGSVSFSIGYPGAKEASRRRLYGGSVVALRRPGAGRPGRVAAR